MSQRSDRRRHFLPLLLVLTLLAHGLALVAPFQFDDEHQIELNPAMKDPRSIPRFFVDPWIGSALGNLRFYRPVLFVTFVVDGVIGAGAAWPYRVTSLLMLIGLALLARQFARRVLPHLAPAAAAGRRERAADLTALLLVVHPLLNESILLASGRSSLLMALFGLGALTLLTGGAPSGRRQAAILGLTLLALLTKETAVVLGLLAPLVAWATRPGERPWARLAAAWPIVVPVALYTGFHFALPHLPPIFPDAPAPVIRSKIGSVRLLDRPAHGGLALLGLGRLFLVPWGLSLVHEVRLPGGALQLLASLVWPALAAAALFAWRRGGRLRPAGAACAWVLASMGPILLVGLNTPMGEHRVVLAMAGVSAAAALALASLSPAGRRRIAVGLVIGALALLAAVQTWPWRSAVSLWRHETRTYPGNARAWAFLAEAHREAGDLRSATEAVERATRLAPGVPTITGKAAILALETGNLDRAARLAADVVTRDDAFPEMHLILAEHRAVRGDLAAALAHARRGLELNPELSAAWNALGNVLLLMGDRDCVGAYRRAVELDPENREAAVNLERALRAHDNPGTE